ncbi:unnamed protein product [Durusdinium trenchii]|uniref:Uncharacterized protein n=1 Tax=Durusdinium trenchii TaxID=1381693 RepID=A0ABP0Q1A3_9DINO
MGQAQSGFDSSCSGKSRDSRHGSLGPVGAQTQQQFLSPDANESSGGTMLGSDLSGHLAEQFAAGARQDTVAFAAQPPEVAAGSYVDAEEFRPSVLDASQREVSTWTGRETQIEVEFTRRNIKTLQDEFALVAAQRQQMEERQAELNQAKEKLFDELQHMRGGSLTSCAIS